MTPPLKIRRLRAEMALKDLDLRTVARKAKIPYTVASELLSGRKIAPERLRRISAVIEKAAMPEEPTYA